MCQISILKSTILWCGQRHSSYVAHPPHLVPPGLFHNGREPPLDVDRESGLVLV